MCGSCQAKRTQAGNGDDSSFGANYGRRQQRRQKEMTWGRCGEAEWANWARTQVVCAELHLMAVYGQTVRTPESAVSSKASTRSSARHHASCENNQLSVEKPTVRRTVVEQDVASIVLRQELPRKLQSPSCEQKLFSRRTSHLANRSEARKIQLNQLHVRAVRLYNQRHSDQFVCLGSDRQLAPRLISASAAAARVGSRHPITICAPHRAS